MPKEISHVREYLPAQKEFMECRSRYVLLSGAFGAGKSFVGCDKIKFLSMFYPGNRCLIVRKSFASLANSTLFTLLIGKPGFPPVIPPELIVNHHKTNHCIEVRTPDPLTNSFIFYAGLDDPDTLGSFAELGAIFIDEGIQTDELDWSQLVGRLRHNVPFRQLYTATNPGSPDHYLYKKFFDDFDQPRKDSDYYCIQTCSFDNHYLPDEYLESLEDLEGVYRERYAYGRWVAAGDMIYDIFKKKTHCYPNFDVPSDWERWRSFDFGFVHPFVCQWWAKSPVEHSYEAGGRTWIVPEGADVMYREIYQTGTLPEDASQWVKRESAGENISYSVGDWDAPARETFGRNGIVIKAANKEVLSGLEAVYLKMRKDKTSDPPSPGLILFKDARCHPEDTAQKLAKFPVCTAGEIPAYQRKGIGIDSEMPRKKNDDGCDAMRYGRMSRVAKGRQGPLLIRATMVH